MRLFRVCPDAGWKSKPQDYKPEEGIALSLIRNVPCLTPTRYGWETDAMRDKGMDVACYILPVVLNKTTNAELQDKIRTRKNKSTIDSYTLKHDLKYASLHKNPDNVNYLKEEECNENQDVIVSLELPLSAAQPCYELEGNIDILLGAYATYYDKEHKIEKENALCSAIVRMGERSKVSFTYTNRYGSGEQIKNLMGYKFEFICSDGYLLRLNDRNFEKLFSSFIIDQE